MATDSNHQPTGVRMTRRSLTAAAVALMAGLFASTSPTFAETKAPAPADVKPIRALLVLGGCCHDYTAQQKILSEGIAARTNVKITIAFDPTGDTKHLNPVYENP